MTPAETSPRQTALGCLVLLVLLALVAAWHRVNAPGSLALSIRQRVNGRAGNRQIFDAPWG